MVMPDYWLRRFHSGCGTLERRIVEIKANSCHDRFASKLRKDDAAGGR